MYITSKDVVASVKWCFELACHGYACIHFQGFVADLEELGMVDRWEAAVVGVADERLLAREEADKPENWGNVYVNSTIIMLHVCTWI